MTTDFQLPAFLDDGYKPAIAPRTLRYDLGDEAIVWASTHHAPLYLDPAAALISSIFDGEGTREEIIEDLDAVLETEPGIAAEQLNRVLFMLAGGGALEYPFAPQRQWTVRRGLLPEPNW